MKRFFLCFLLFWQFVVSCSRVHLQELRSWRELTFHPPPPQFCSRWVPRPFFFLSVSFKDKKGKFNPACCFILLWTTGLLQQRWAIGRTIKKVLRQNFFFPKTKVPQNARVAQKFYWRVEGFTDNQMDRQTHITVRQTPLVAPKGSRQKRKIIGLWAPWKNPGILLALCVGTLICCFPSSCIVVLGF